MTDDLNVQVFTQMAKDAGLDLTRKSDMELFDQACGEYTGDNLTRDIKQVLANAAAKKSGVQMLDDYYRSHPLTQDAPAPTPKPNDKPMSERSGHDILDEYYRTHPL